MGNVISLQDYKVNKTFDKETYSNKLSLLHKIDLLEEMVKYNDDVTIQGFTKNNVDRGLVLYSSLLMKCETPEMTELCKSMLKKLETT